MSIVMRLPGVLAALTHATRNLLNKRTAESGEVLFGSEFSVHRPDLSGGEVL